MCKNFVQVLICVTLVPSSPSAALDVAGYFIPPLLNCLFCSGVAPVSFAMPKKPHTAFGFVCDGSRVARALSIVAANVVDLLCTCRWSNSSVCHLLHLPRPCPLDLCQNKESKAWT